MLSALEGITAEVALRQSRWSAHSIWQLVAHLSAELIDAREVITASSTPAKSPYCGDK